MARFNTSPFNATQFNDPKDRDPQLSQNEVVAQGRTRSFLLQQLLNYFDDADVRVREGRHTLDAQLLNAPALALEELQLRLRREGAVLHIAECPLNADNFGVYHKLAIPDTYEFTAQPDGVLLPPRVRVYTGEQRWKEIVEYDDLLPIPAGVEQAGDGLPCPSLLIYEGDGNGLQQEAEMGDVIFPNRLYLKIDNLDAGEHFVEVRLEGYTHPRTVSLSGQPKTTEALTITEEHVVQTKHAWARVERIVIRNLPRGATLRIAVAPAVFGMEQEVARPAIHAAYRDTIFQRYWRLRGDFLDELLYFNRFAKFEPLNVYACSPRWSAFALEPNSYGIYGIQDNFLVYADRREPLPDNLARTAIYREPLYNLIAFPDTTEIGAIRKVVLQPIRNARSSDCYRYRFAVETPAGAQYCLSPEGILIRKTINSGWRTGVPQAVTIPVQDTGSYRFTLETADVNDDIYEDVAVLANQSVRALAKSDVSSLLPGAEALVYDRYHRLWIWTGDLMVPMRLRYDNFVFDADTRNLYLTDSYQQVELS